MSGRAAVTGDTGRGNGDPDRRADRAEPGESGAVAIRPAARLRGEPGLPGDKSISHRALLLAALADGESRIDGAGDGEDVRTTAALIERLGVVVERFAADGRRVDYRVVSPGVDGLVEADGVLDCGNSGTTLRLATGILAGLAADPRPRRRSLVAAATGGSYHRTAALDGRGAPCAPERFPSATDRGRPHPAPGDRRDDRRPERPGEVGDPAGGAAGRRSDDRPRGDRDPRSHRADAPGARGAGRARGDRGWAGFGLESRGRGTRASRR